MTTATDWDVHDADTGSHPVVTDVTCAAPEHVMELRTAHALAIRNAELSEQVERLGRENAELRAAMGAWVPPQSSLRTRRDQLATLRTPREVTGIGDLTDAEKHLAMVAPTTEELTGYDDDLEVVPNPIAGAVADWPIWLGDVHHADKAVSQAVADLRSWPDAYAAQPVERTVVEPVQVSDRYAEIRLRSGLMHAGLTNRASVYNELAPERIQDTEPDEPPSEPERIESDVPMIETSGHERQPEDREALNRLTKRVPTAISAPPPTQVAGHADTSNEAAAELEAEPDGWVPATWWARALAWIGSRRKRGV